MRRLKNSFVERWCHTKQFATKIFIATQRCNIVATLFRIVTTLFQHCNAVLRCKSSLLIVPCNIILSSPICNCEEGWKLLDLSNTVQQRLDLCSSTSTKTPFITPGKVGWREIKNKTVIVMNLPLAVEKGTFKNILRLVPENSKQCRSFKTRTREQVWANSNKNYPIYGNLKLPDWSCA